MIETNRITATNTKTSSPEASTKTSSPEASTKTSSPVRRKRRKAKSRKANTKTSSPVLAGVMAVAAGCTTPAAALAMSTITGHVAGSSQPLFALLPGLILACLLIVSTPHIAEAKQCIGWKGWQAWSFAIALDCAITVCELLHVLCTDAVEHIAWLPTMVIVGAVLYSALLNVYCNLRHAGLVE